MVICPVCLVGGRLSQAIGVQFLRLYDSNCLLIGQDDSNGLLIGRLVGCVSSCCWSAGPLDSLWLFGGGHLFFVGWLVGQLVGQLSIDCPVD